MKSLYVTLICIMLLSGCGGIQIRTNLGEAVIRDVAEHKIRILDRSDPIPADAKFIADLTGLSCQTRVESGKATKARAMNDIKVQAISMGADVLMVSHCQIETAASCLSLIECQGQAYQLY